MSNAHRKEVLKMILGFMRNFKNPTNMAKLTTMLCNYHGISLVYIRPQDVNMEKDQVKGKMFINNKWVVVQIDLPSLIDISPYCFKKGNKKVMNYLKENTFLTSNNKRFHKDQLQSILLEDSKFAHLVIPSLKIQDNFCDMETFLQKHSTIVMKPIDGERGRNIYILEKIGEKFLLGHQKKEKQMSRNEIIDFFETSIKNKRYLIQKYISSRSLQGDPFDCRIHVEKNGEGKWVSARNFIRIGIGQKVISNVSQGGGISDPEPFLKANFGDAWGEINQKIKELAVTLPYKLEESKDIKIMTMGMDIGIDKSGELYLFEVNTAPITSPLKSEAAMLRVDYYKFILNNMKKDQHSSKVTVIENKEVKHFTQGSEKMVAVNKKLPPMLTDNVVAEPKGFMLDAYLIALEGWRRGLTLKWYKAETDVCKLDRMKGTTSGRFFSLSTNDKTHYFFRSRGDKVANKAVGICQNKEKTKELLLASNIPIAKGHSFHVNDADNDIFNYALDIGFPLVVKPRNGSMGTAVYTNIQNEKELLGALNDLRKTYRFKEYLIEKYFPGNEYRVYVVGDQVIGATKRVPANVIGDGNQTITELIEEKNQERKKNPYLAPKPIKVDYEVSKQLKDLGYNLDTIPVEGETVYLRVISNLSSGGDPLEATHELSREVKKMAVDALKALPKTPHAGVDVIVDPTSEKKAIVLEINATAEISFHLFPLSGEAKDVPSAIVDYYFPETVNARKTNHYFDFETIMMPLASGFVDEIEIPKASRELTFTKKYIVSGNLRKVGYMSRVKKEASIRNLNGYVKKVKNGKVEVVVSSDNEKSVKEFKEICINGSRRSVVDDVKELNYGDGPIKIGFEMIT